MSMLGLDELWRLLVERDETVQVEAKAGSEVGPSMMETVSAFSNEPGRGGGYLLLGVGLAPDTLFPTYEIDGVADPDKVQSDLATQCRSVFNHPVRPEIAVEVRNGRRVVVAYVPEAQDGDKPIFVAARGLPRGAFRRIGSTDQACTEDDLALFYQAQSQRSFDETVLPDLETSDLDPEALNDYRRARREANPDAIELTYGDEEMLYSLCCVSRHEGRVSPTLAGLALFGRHAAIRRHMPLMRVDYIRVPGREWVRSPDDRRFESIDMLGPLMKVIPRAINAVLDDIPKAFRLPPDSDRRRDVPIIPRKAIREAIVNAVMHRSYRRHQPVQIIRYSNRLEIRNPGVSLKPDDRLGEPGSMARNPKLAAVLHETDYAETKGSGIRAIRQAMTDAGLSPPTFESNRDDDAFVVTFLFHHFLTPEDLTWLGRFSDHGLTEDENRALVFVREVGAINNAAYRDINRVDTLAASGHLRRLRDAGLLGQKGKSVGTYYVPTVRLIDPPETQGVTPSVSTPSQGAEPAPDQPNPLPLPEIEKPLGGRGKPRGLGPNLGGLPRGLRDQVQGLGRRGDHPLVRSVIRQLCDWKPLTADEIAAILGRNKVYLANTYLAPMVRDGELRYRFPDQPAHPQQAYITTT